MKTSEEFRAAVYEKQSHRLAARRRMKKQALLCVPLAILIVLGSVFLPKTAFNGWAARQAAANQEADPTSFAAAAEDTEAAPGAVAGALHTAQIPLLLQVARPSAPKTASFSALQNAAKYALQSASHVETKRASDTAQAEPETSWQESEEALKELTETALIETDFSRALNDFARDTVTELQSEFGENACFSPLSLYFGLALTGSGAGGVTAQEFQSVLHDKGDGWVERQCGNYYRQHYHRSEESSFLLANSLWMDGRYSFDDDFIAGAEENFYSSLFQADFTDPALSREVSKWISETTDGQLTPEMDFSEDERLAIVNTVSYRAQWITPFFPEYNTREAFHKADGSTVTAEFMHTGIDRGSVYEGDGFLRASLPLQNGGEMIFILPEEGVSPQELIADPAAFEEMFYPKAEEEFAECRIRWSVPKFSFDCEYDLIDTLKKLGLETALDQDRADFSAMDGGGNADKLYLSRVRKGIHACVAENGIGAASYTLVALQAEGISEPADRLVEMTLDRPFLFAFANKDTTLDSAETARSLTFVGICGDPTVTEE